MELPAAPVITALEAPEIPRRVAEGFENLGFIELAKIGKSLKRALAKEHRDPPA
jgi:hypothetical protein